jgi:Amt family ammonium transporter
LDVFPVHGVGGILGTMLVGVFASSELGIFSGQGLAEGVSIASQLNVQFMKFNQVCQSIKIYCSICKHRSN